MLRTCWDVLKQMQSNSGNLCVRSLTRCWYPAIYLMIAKMIWAMLIGKKSKKDDLAGKKLDQMLFKQN